MPKAHLPDGAGPGGGPCYFTVSKGVLTNSYSSNFQSRVELPVSSRRPYLPQYLAISRIQEVESKRRPAEEESTRIGDGETITEGLLMATGIGKKIIR